MVVFAIDAEAAIDLARREFALGADREIFAPTLLRSQVLTSCLAAVRTNPTESQGAAVG